MDLAAPSALPDIRAIRAAAARLAPVVRRTPLLCSPFLDPMAGRRVWVKAECLQHTGSFKVRGAWAAVSALPPGTPGVIAVSSGNHAQGVALAAARHGLPAVVVMPADAPAVKIARTRALGAEVVTCDRFGADRDALAAGLAAERGLHLIPPFDHREVIAGQGSVGLEIADQAAEAGIGAADVVVCCGGGGLSAGIALALEDRAPGLRVRTAEPAGFDDTARSLAAGERLANPPGAASVCDAILTPAPGRLTLPVLARLAGPGLVVTDAEAMAAMALAFAHLRIVLEPGGAVALAAALFRPGAFAGADVIAVASGGNVDPALFARALADHPAG
jgi:threonine dehydratase